MPAHDEASDALELSPSAAPAPLKAGTAFAPSSPVATRWDALENSNFEPAEPPGASRGENGAWATIAATFKSIVGPAILYLPNGFAQAGLLGAVVCLGVSFGLFVFGILTLLEVWRETAVEGRVPARRGGFVRLPAAEVEADELDMFRDRDDAPLAVDAARVAEALEDARGSVAGRGGAVERLVEAGGYMGLAHLGLGVKGVYAVLFCSLVLQCGCCLTYYIFIAEHGQRLLQHFCGVEVGLRPLIAAHAAVQVVLAMPRRIESYTTTNVIANTCVIFALFVILGIASEGVRNEGVAGDIEAFKWSSFYIFVGMAMFCFEGAAPLTIPLLEATQPALQPYFSWLYVGTVFGIMCLMSAFATTCYLFYGAGVSVIVTLDLPDGTWPGAVVQLVYCVAVLFTFPLMLFPVTGFLVQAFGGDDEHKHGRNRNDLIRLLLVAALGVIAALTVHALDHVVALLGCLASTPLALILPPLMHLRLVKQSRCSRIRNVGSVVVGSVVTVVTTVITLVTWGSAAS